MSPSPEAGGEGCLYQGQSRALKKHPSRMHCGHSAVSNAGHGHAQAGRRSPPQLTPLSSSETQEQSPQRNHSCTGRVAHLCFPTSRLMRPPGISENTPGIPGPRRQHDPLSCPPGAVENVTALPLHFESFHAYRQLCLDELTQKNLLNSLE